MKVNNCIYLQELFLIFKKTSFSKKFNKIVLTLSSSKRNRKKRKAVTVDFNKELRLNFPIIKFSTLTPAPLRASRPAVLPLRLTGSAVWIRGVIKEIPRKNQPSRKSGKALTQDFGKMKLDFEFKKRNSFLLATVRIKEWPVPEEGMTCLLNRPFIATFPHLHTYFFLWDH